MTFPTLLTTKLSFPPLRANLIPRPHLVEKLTNSIHAPFTLVSAPAGYGKTTLLSEWRVGTGKNYPAAWLSLDTDDNEPARFLNYLIAALQNIKSGFGETALQLLHSSRPPPDKTILTILINELGELVEPFALVMDDYQFINTQPVHDTIAYILEHPPPQMHLVMLTRADPPFPLARLRARNQMSEIRAADLRFTLAETTDFMQQVMGVKLSEKDIIKLEQRVEGWAAGLQLAGLSMQGRDDLSNFIASFGGGYHYIVDYLVEEVLNRQSESLRLFLLQTSILDRLTGPLCELVTGQTNGQSTLEELEKANLFVIPLGGECCWYRYHHLFADVLRNYLRQSYPDLILDLHQRAGRWFAQEGHVVEAIRHTLAAGAYEAAATLIEQFASTISFQGNVAGLLTWTDALPPDVIKSHPRLGLAQAWALYFEYEFDQAEARLRDIEQNLTSEDAALISGEVALLSGVMARRSGNLELSQICLQQALNQLPPGNHVLRSRAWVYLGLVYLETDANRAYQALSQALATASAVRDLHGIQTSSYFLTWTLMLLGELSQASGICRRALLLTEEMPYWPVASFAYSGMGELLYEFNQLDQAQAHLQKAFELAETGGNADYLFTASLALARVHRHSSCCARSERELYNATLSHARLYRALGEWEIADGYIHQAERLAHRMQAPFLIALVTDEQARLSIAKNELDQARLRVSENVQALESSTILPYVLENLAWARVAIARHEPKQALQRLDELLQLIENAGMRWFVIQNLNLQALAYEMDGQGDRALDNLARALSIGEAGGFVRTFLDEGPAMARLLRRARSQGIMPQYVAKLLAEFTKEQKPDAVFEQTLIEPLSKRELEVLRLIAAGCSNKEIASQLFITISTVKRHTVTIFQKLGVENRTQAVAQARGLRLL